jgi:hypothetical protein
VHADEFLLDEGEARHYLLFAIPDFLEYQRIHVEKKMSISANSKLGFEFL